MTEPNSKRIFFLAAFLITVMPGVALFSTAAPNRSPFPGWRMFAEARPVCTLRFRFEKEDPAGKAHAQVMAQLSSTSWLNGGGRKVRPIFEKEESAREFLRWLCGTGKAPPGTRFDLSCFNPGRGWTEVDSGRELACS